MREPGSRGRAFWAAGAEALGCPGEPRGTFPPVEEVAPGHRPSPLSRPPRRSIPKIIPPPVSERPRPAAERVKGTIHTRWGAVMKKVVMLVLVAGVGGFAAYRYWPRPAGPV